MAKKAVKKSTRKVKKAPYAHSHHHHHESNNLLLIVAGGFVVLIILMFMLANMKNIFGTGNSAQAVEVVEIQEVDY